jgi:phosphoglycolate phosphatase
MDTIIWDWNGTLLDDLDLCISTINILLDKRKLSLLDHNSYKEAFSFPVEKYYRTIGFDFEKEDFSIPAGEFINLYNNSITNCSLHKSAFKILSWFKNRGTRQFVLSAMKQTMLEETLIKKGIYSFFEGVAGLNDHYAVSKIERGRQLIDEFKINKETACIIGDTNHDFEVAQSLGTGCILVADGHQSAGRLKETGAVVLSSLEELITL